MELSDALYLSKQVLLQAGVPSPEADSYWLLAHTLEIPKSELLTLLTLGYQLTEAQAGGFKENLDKRASRIPLQHITGSAGFRNIELHVGPGVFIPRYETEQVVEIAIKILSGLPGRPRVVDVGTGSGAIAISLAKETAADVYAIEIDAAAAEFAIMNIKSLTANVDLRIGKFEEELPKLRDLDLIISNPPYIPLDAVPVDPEVRDFDPQLALYSGADGLEAIKELIALAPVSLKSGGWVVLEHADGQSDMVCELLLSAGYEAIRAHPDAAGRLRAVSAKWRS
ncbi:MAG: peptide chain release factor N(5)-glutamine methyltransferase [Actinobacteria bacterium]|uniref:peptide chain release factor N(5)-glutamine methyltransferase n=1 Tax=freshwater metagenome TaxID=449393 RepID=A0A6J6CH23_9ZZZZ|nr:peptide chain release factor N(5)-glutamine methyltransferase [Actinomycetota bacterium]